MHKATSHNANPNVLTGDIEVARKPPRAQISIVVQCDHLQCSVSKLIPDWEVRE
jgi:hypothetical protein